MQDAFDVLPLLGLYVPAGQATHAAALDCRRQAVVAAGSAGQAGSDPSRRRRRSQQGKPTQDAFDVLPLLGLYVPAGQATHAAAPDCPVKLL